MFVGRLGTFVALGVRGSGMIENCSFNLGEFYVKMGKTNRKLEDTRMKIVIINGSARKGNTLAAINAFIKGASEKNKIEIIEPDKLNIAPC